MFDLDIFDSAMMPSAFASKWMAMDREYTKLAQKQLNDLRKNAKSSATTDDISLKKDLSHPQIKLSNIAHDDENYKFEFSLKDIPASDIQVNAYEDPCKGNTYLRLIIVDKKKAEHSYESEDKVVKKLVASMSTPENLDMGFSGRIGISTTTDPDSGSSSAAEASGFAASSSTTTLSPTYITVTHYKRFENVVDYPLPADVAEEALNNIRAERSDNTLITYIPRSYNSMKFVHVCKNNTVNNVNKNNSTTTDIDNADNMNDVNDVTEEERVPTAG